jgi:DeoR family fructose operon transcriptional repressor
MNNEHATADLAVERQERIRARLLAQRVVRVDELAEWLQISAATVRRDLLELEQQGRLRRVHGGATEIDKNLDEPLFDDKTAIATTEKRAIAEAAFKLINPTDTVFLDGGSTILVLAHLLLPLAHLTVVTNSLRVAQLLSGNGPRMILTGGECRRLSQTFVGPLSRPVLERVQLDWAFMGTIGVSAEAGLTTTDPNEAFTKELAISRARRIALLADSTKFGKSSFVRFGDAGQLTHLITDSAAPAAQLEAFRRIGVEVVTT